MNLEFLLIITDQIKNCRSPYELFVFMMAFSVFRTSVHSRTSFLEKNIPQTVQPKLSFVVLYFNHTSWGVVYEPRYYTNRRVVLPRYLYVYLFVIADLLGCTLEIACTSHQRHTLGESTPMIRGEIYLNILLLYTEGSP